LEVFLVSALRAEQAARTTSAILDLRERGAVLGVRGLF
jgi:hypothetical protein